MIQECKIPSEKPIFMDFAEVTGQVLNSYPYYSDFAKESKEKQNSKSEITYWEIF